MIQINLKYITSTIVLYNILFGKVGIIFVIMCYFIKFFIFLYSFILFYDTLLISHC